MENYSEEELKAIEKVKKLLENASPFSMPPSMYFSLETILNLILKQQKEIENSVSKDKIRKKINERQFELQQEYKDFKDDIRLNTLQEIYYIERK